MSKALIISKAIDNLDSITQVTADCGFKEISVSNGENARKTVAETDYSLIILITPLENEYGLELTSDISKASSAGIIIITKADNVEEVTKKISFTGAFVMAKPISRAMLSQSIRFVMLAREAIMSLITKNEELEKRIDDLKLIDRAKCVLIEYLRISEAQAHRHIQKQAMDQRVSQVTVARNILNTYEA